MALTTPSDVHATTLCFLFQWPSIEVVHAHCDGDRRRRFYEPPPPIVLFWRAPKFAERPQVEAFALLTAALKSYHAAGVTRHSQLCQGAHASTQAAPPPVWAAAPMGSSLEGLCQQSNAPRIVFLIAGSLSISAVLCAVNTYHAQHWSLDRCSHMRASLVDFKKIVASQSRSLSCSPIPVGQASCANV